MIEYISSKQLSLWNYTMLSKDLQDDEDDYIPGYYIVTDVLDLHGVNPKLVKEMIEEFIENALILELEELRIIHGKGKSKLKYLTYKALENNKYVESFFDAPPERGGWGATIVLLK